MSRSSRVRIACVALTAASLAGCTTTMKMEGKLQLEGPLTLSEGSYVGSEMFDRLEVGSDAMWSVALFGEPDQRTTLGDGSSVWRWTFRHYAMDTSLSPSLLLSPTESSDDDDAEADPEKVREPERTTITNTYVHVVHGRVDSKWQD